MSLWIYLLAVLSTVTCLYSYTEETSAIAHAITSIYAVRRDTGEILLSDHCDVSMVPASCMKIVTTAAALKILGASMQFETHLEYDGSIDETQTIQGNLYIRGGGDPCLGSDRLQSSHSFEKQLDLWVSAVLKLGVSTIRGNVIADTTQWEKGLAPPSWSWEDVGNYYGAGASALSFHENCYSVYFKPSHILGGKAKVLRTDPPLPADTLDSEVTTGPEGSGDCACIFGGEYSPLQYIRGTIPLGKEEFAIKGAVANPAALCRALLAAKLQERGIAIEGKQMEPQRTKTTLHTTYSPTLGDIVLETNRCSINLYAEHLLKKLGEKKKSSGSTRAGIEAVREFWSSEGIDLCGFHMADGSGLSRQNLITAKQLVQMLQKIEKWELFPLFFDSLPKHKGSMRAKSGGMSCIRGYAGYTNHIVFAVFINHCVDRRAMHQAMQTHLETIHRLDQSITEGKR